MSILLEAMAAVQRVVSLVFLYIISVVFLSSIQVGASHFLSEAGISGLPEWCKLPADFPLLARLNDLPWIPVLAYFLLVPALAAIQTAVFIRMGRALDKPLWKCSGMAAVKQFYPIWFLLNLITMLAWQLAQTGVISGHTGQGRAAFFVFFIFSVITVPLGACLMFHRGRTLHAMWEAVLPLFRDTPRALVILLFNGFQVVLILLLQPELSNNLWALPFLNIVPSYCDCVVFAAVWLLCIADRNRLENPYLDL